MADLPSLTVLTDALGSPAGNCGTTATRPRPRSGETPSHWWITGQSTPYAPQACMTMDRSVKSRSILAPKSGLGAISGMAPGISHTVGSSWLRALPRMYWPCSSSPRRPKLPSLTAAIALLSVKVTRSLGTAETTESQLGPGLPAAAEVGPVPVWKSPNSPVLQDCSCSSRVALACASE